MTLEQKVHSLTRGDAVRSRSHEKVPYTNGSEDQYQHELDLVDWGVTFGMAFALARLEDALEPVECVAYRARQAAWRVQVVSGHGFSRDPQMPTDADRRAVDYVFSPESA